MVHGSHRSSRTFMRNIPALGRHFRVYAPDLPGYGDSDPVRDREPLPDMVEFLCEFALAVDARSAHWIGESRGGGYCIQFAARKPGNVASLVLVSPVGLPPRELPKPAELSTASAWEWFLERSVEDPSCFDDADREALLRNLGKASPYEKRRLAATSPQYNRMGLVDDIVCVTAPVMLAWGRQDPVFPVECMERFRELLPNVQRTLVLDRARHLCFMERSDEFNEAVISFFQQPQPTTETPDVIA
ncbi:alpha/beta fold hydrolase [Micromonospora tulbaghiae]|uniref:alpha/beta fold hydrolase n=1 Tax=Micromonospora tulbaghiae TaxID=479978 RepID=UPI0036ABBDC3